MRDALAPNCFPKRRRMKAVLRHRPFGRGRSCRCSISCRRACRSVKTSSSPCLPLVDRAARRANAIIASSTSGLLPTRLQSTMARPERFVVRLRIPSTRSICCRWLKSVVARKPAEETKQTAMELYRSVGMRPLHVRKEIDGFIGRPDLLEALLARGSCGW